MCLIRTCLPLLSPLLRARWCICGQDRIRCAPFSWVGFVRLHASVNRWKSNFLHVLYVHRACVEDPLRNYRGLLRSCKFGRTYPQVSLGHTQTVCRGALEVFNLRIKCFSCSHFTVKALLSSDFMRLYWCRVVPRLVIVTGNQKSRWLPKPSLLTFGFCFPLHADFKHIYATFRHFSEENTCGR